MLIVDFHCYAPSVKTWYNTTNTCRENELYSTVYSAEKDG